MVNLRKNVELANQLRKDILTGKYGTEGGLPGAKELSRRSGFARNTVNSALALLEGERLIIRRDVTYYVNTIPVTMTQYAPPTHIRYSDGYATDLIISGEKLLPDHLASRLDMDRCTAYRVQVSGETVSGERQPLQYSHRYYFLPLTDEEMQHMKDDAKFDPVWIIADILVSRDETCARYGTQEEITHLDLPTPSPVQGVWESIRDKQGNLLMVQETTLVPRFKLIFEFEFSNIQR